MSENPEPGSSDTPVPLEPSETPTNPDENDQTVPPQSQDEAETRRKHMDLLLFIEGAFAESPSGGKDGTAAAPALAGDALVRSVKSAPSMQTETTTTRPKPASGAREVVKELVSPFAEPSTSRHMVPLMTKVEARTRSKAVMPYFHYLGPHQHNYPLPSSNKESKRLSSTDPHDKIVMETYEVMRNAGKKSGLVAPDAVPGWFCNNWHFNRYTCEKCNRHCELPPHGPVSGTVRRLVDSLAKQVFDAHTRLSAYGYFTQKSSTEDAKTSDGGDKGESSDDSEPETNPELGHTQSVLSDSILKSPVSVLVERTEELVDSMRCAVCYCETPNVSLHPCGHVCLCSNCFREMGGDDGKLSACPLCRREVTEVLCHFPLHTGSMFGGVHEWKCRFCSHPNLFRCYQKTGKVDRGQGKTDTGRNSQSYGAQQSRVSHLGSRPQRHKYIRQKGPCFGGEQAVFSLKKVLDRASALRRKLRTYEDELLYLLLVEQKHEKDAKKKGEGGGTTLTSQPKMSLEQLLEQRYRELGYGGQEEKSSQEGKDQSDSKKDTVRECVKKETFASFGKKIAQAFVYHDHKVLHTCRLCQKQRATVANYPCGCLLLCAGCADVHRKRITDIEALWKRISDYNRLVDLVVSSESKRHAARQACERARSGDTQTETALTTSGEQDGSGQTILGDPSADQSVDLSMLSAEQLQRLIAIRRLHEMESASSKQAESSKEGNTVHLLTHKEVEKRRRKKSKKSRQRERRHRQASREKRGENDEPENTEEAESKSGDASEATGTESQKQATGPPGSLEITDDDPLLGWCQRPSDVSQCAECRAHVIRLVKTFV